ncbi:MAG TPA: DUF2062 domain-containing protein [Elusimicrobia bacterium]|nr:DUF2062 domain-containing protein [Elusimicrobiota bacterium]
MTNDRKSWVETAKDKILRVNDTPERIAFGFSIGAFIGIFPTFYLGGIITLALCALFKLNYAAGILGSVIVMNPVSTPIFWGLSAYVGSLFYPTDVHLILAQIKNGKIFKSLGEISLVYLTGNLIIASIVAVVSYYLVRRLVVSYRKGRGV